MKTKMLHDLKNHAINLQNRIRGIRTVTVLIMIICFMDMYMMAFRDSVRSMGVQTNSLILPFVQTSDFCMKMMFMGIVYFYSNVPFMEKAELFYLNRMGKKRWGVRNLCYILGSSFLLTVSLLLISLVEASPVGRPALVWDSAIKTVGLTGGNMVEFKIPYQILKTYLPLPLMGYTLLLDWGVIMFLGLLMYVISMYGRRTLACVAAILVVLLPSINMWVGGRLIYYSPLSWLDCSNWRIGYDNAKPDMVYMLTALLFADVFLAMLSQRRVTKMEWKTLDD